MFFRALAFCLVVAVPALAQEELPEPGMTLDRMLRLILAIDPEAKPAGSGITFTVEDVPVMIIVDPPNDRMRAMVPIRSAADMTEEDMRRVMQANFDTALDARYAVANGRLWGVFIHPLKPLERAQFLSGIGQTVNLALTYGTLYSGGAMSFGSGDSLPLQRGLIDRLLEKGQEL